LPAEYFVLTVNFYLLAQLFQGAITIANVLFSIPGKANISLAFHGSVIAPFAKAVGLLNQTKNKPAQRLVYQICI